MNHAGSGTHLRRSLIQIHQRPISISAAEAFCFRNKDSVRSQDHGEQCGLRMNGLKMHSGEVSSSPGMVLPPHFSISLGGFFWCAPCLTFRCSLSLRSLRRSIHLLLEELFQAETDSRMLLDTRTERITLMRVLLQEAETSHSTHEEDGEEDGECNCCPRGRQSLQRSKGRSRRRKRRRRILHDL
ncbi:unnamed protein product [Amoebophrya sp. A25]|nr:unnamed protein product [Amoebophrya sp. A25]|eukprot:GSA25T00027030001.1